MFTLPRNNFLQKAYRKKKQWRDATVLIVDEISMIDGELFDKIEEIARVIRNSQIPFGGIQLLLCGDFLQVFFFFDPK